MSKKKDQDNAPIENAQNETPAETLNDTPTTQEIRVVEPTAQIQKLQKATYLAIDLVTGEEVEFSPEVWVGQKYKELVSQKLINELKAANPEIKLENAKEGYKRYQLVAKKDAATNERLTMQQAREAVKTGKVGKPNCLTC